MILGKPHRLGSGFVDASQEKGSHYHHASHSHEGKCSDVCWSFGRVLCSFSCFQGQLTWSQVFPSPLSAPATASGAPDPPGPRRPAKPLLASRVVLNPVREEEKEEEQQAWPKYLAGTSNSQRAARAVWSAEMVARPGRGSRDHVCRAKYSHCLGYGSYGQDR